MPHVAFKRLTAFRESLEPDSAQSLLYRLVSWLIRLISQSEGPLVVRKICSTLVVFFLRFPSSWELCVRHLLCSLYKGDAVPLTSIDQYPATPALVRALNKSQAVAALWFISTLVEDVGKTDSNNIRQ